MNDSCAEPNTYSLISHFEKEKMVYGITRTGFVKEVHFFFC